MALTDEESGVARATGNVVDRVQRNRNKLVQLAQDGDDDDRAFAVNALKQLNEQYGGLSRPGANPGAEQNQHDDSPSKPLFKGIAQMEATENPTGIDKAGNAIAMGVLHPDKLANPAWRRQMLQQYDKGLTGGVVTRLGRAITEPFGARDMSPESMEQYAKEAPLTGGERAGAQILGAVTPGSLGRTVAGAAERGLMNLPGIGRAAAGAPRAIGALVGAGSASAAGAAQQGTAALTSGSGLPAALHAAKDAATDPLSLALGAAGGAVSATGSSIRANNRDVQNIEAAGGRVGPFNPGSGGDLESPLVQSGIERGRVTEAGKGRVSRQAADATADALQARAAGAGHQLRAGIEDARNSGALTQSVDASGLYHQAQEMVNNPMLPRSVRGQIQQEILSDVMDPLADAQRAVGGNRPLMMTADEMNQLKRKLQYFSDYVPAGKPGTSEPHFAGMAHDAAQNVGDDLGRLNRQAANEYSGVENAREALGIPGGANQPIPLSQRESLASRLGRRGADTRTAGQMENPGIEEALQRYPELRQFVEAPELLQSRANLEFGIKGNKVGGLGEWLKGIVGRNIDPATVRLLAPLLTSGGNAVRAAAPNAGSFIENLGEGTRRRMDQR